MGNEIRLILAGIANSLNSNGYYNIVTPPRKLGETATMINKKRAKNYKRIQKVTDERTTRLTASS